MTFNAFVKEMGRHLPPHARLLFCQFRGDPYQDTRGKWRAHVLNIEEPQVDERANVYFCVSAMQRNSKGEFRRRKENFAGGLLLMIDDLGDGPGAKFPLSIVDPLPPTCLIETSPDNYQAIYMFDSLVTSMRKFDALIRAFIAEQFLTEDTGMAGVNRVFRPPIGVNGKPKYGGWNVRCGEVFADRRYSIDEIATAFNLTLVEEMPRPRDLSILEGHKATRIEAFIEVHKSLDAAGMVKSHAPDQAEWLQITCPWMSNHSGVADSGAAIRLPNVENGYYGGFRCHHGGCVDRGWADLTQWLAEEQEEMLGIINESWARLSRESSGRSE